MEDIYTFEVPSEMFDKILAKKKVIHLAINDNKHKAYTIGNQIKTRR